MYAAVRSIGDLLTSLRDYLGILAKLSTIIYGIFSDIGCSEGFFTTCCSEGAITFIRKHIQDNSRTTCSPLVPQTGSLNQGSCGATRKMWLFTVSLHCSDFKHEANMKQKAWNRPHRRNAIVTSTTS